MFLLHWLFIVPHDYLELTHWGRETHICVSKLTIIASDNGLSPGWRQAIIWTNVRILLIGPLGTNFGEILIEFLIFSFKIMHLKLSSAKRRPFCLGLNELSCSICYTHCLRVCFSFDWIIEMTLHEGQYLSTDRKLDWSFDSEINHQINQSIRQHIPL